MKTAIRSFAHASLVLAALVLLPGCGGGDGSDAPLNLVIPRDTDAGAAQRPQVTLAVDNGAGISGTVAMARTSDLNSATSEFFINLVNNDFLDTSSGGYAAFGYITDMTLVNAMTQAPCVASNITGGAVYGCLPVPNLVITSAVQTR